MIKETLQVMFAQIPSNENFPATYSRNAQSMNLQKQRIVKSKNFQFTAKYNINNRRPIQLILPNNLSPTAYAHQL